MFEGEFVRQVDDETRVAPGGAVGDSLGIYQNNARLRQVLGQAPCGGKPSKASTDHHIIGVMFAT
ncbi:hypothetical protein D9M71_304150 [compost metagenome]